MTEAGETVLVLGADGFIGRHVITGLRDAGWQVIASARRVKRLSHMGFETLQADLCDPATHVPEYWRAKLVNVTHVVNAAGVLAGPDATAKAVHELAPDALYSALPSGATGLLISAVGIDGSDSGFARHRRAGEQIASAHGITILRAGLVLGETSYGGSSLARALAAWPLVTPVVGRGDQAFNPIHAADLSAAIAHLLHHPPGPGCHDIGGAQSLSQAEMLRALRAWLGLRPVPILRVPLAVAGLIGRIGDALRLGPISATAVTQLRAGVLARPGSAVAGLPVQPRGFSRFLRARPAGTQDLWHARLYLMRPVLRLGLALLWLVSGVIGLTLPGDAFLPLLPDAPLSDAGLIALARFGGIVDLAIAVALIRGWRPRLMAWVQAGMVAGYTLIFSLLAPVLWLLPLGGLLKNPGLVILILLHGILEDER